MHSGSWYELITERNDCFQLVQIQIIKHQKVHRKILPKQKDTQLWKWKHIHHEENAVEINGNLINKSVGIYNGVNKEQLFSKRPFFINSTYGGNYIVGYWAPPTLVKYTNNKYTRQFSFA